MTTIEELSSTVLLLSKSGDKLDQVTCGRESLGRPQSSVQGLWETFGTAEVFALKILWF